MGIVVIVNPVAGSGRAKRRAQVVSRALTTARLPCDVRVSRARGHAEELAHQACKNGADAIVAIGGDGTFNEVCQAYLNLQRPGPVLGLLDAGTGGDFARCLSAPQGVPQLVQSLLEHRTRSIDLGVATVARGDGKRTERAFLNVASVGLSAAINRRVEHLKWLGGRLGFLGATVFEALGYRPPIVEIRLDSEVWHHGPLSLAAFANGRYFGGGMKIAPGAKLDDGLLEAVGLRGVGFTELLPLLSGVYSGAHVRDERVRLGKTEHVSVTAVRSSQPLWVDLDGECPGQLPLELHVRKRLVSLLDFEGAVSPESAVRR